jgi:hypothetical protein
LAKGYKARVVYSLRASESGFAAMPNNVRSQLNRSIGWLMYLRHYGDAGFSSRNPAFDVSAAAQCNPASVSRCGGVLVPVIEYRLSNGQLDQYPASWALPEEEVMCALEYFIKHQGARPPFVVWNDDGQRQNSSSVAGFRTPARTI